MPLTEPTPADPNMQRYAPARPFPPYRFVPGLNHHPVAHPRGHMFRNGVPEPKPPYYSPERWRENEEYLLGCDYYNFAYFWEAHEAWEGLWHLTPKNNTEGLFLQGLIQITASNLKRHMAEMEGSLKLANLALQKLKTVQGAATADGMYMGLDVAEFVGACERFLIKRDPAAPFPIIQLSFSVSL